MVTQDDLLQAIALPGWGWRDGMLACCGPQSSERIHFQEYATNGGDGEAIHPRTHRPGRWRLGANFMAEPDLGTGWIPDIRDAATGGALVMLLVEGYRDGHGAGVTQGEVAAQPGLVTAEIPSIEDALRHGWTLGEWAVSVALHRGYWCME